MKRIFVLLFMVFFVTGCSENALLTDAGIEQSGDELAAFSKQAPQQTYCLEGKVRLGMWYAGTGEVAVDPELVFLDAEAEFTTFGKSKAQLHLVESVLGTVVRDTYYDVNISASGNVKFTWPDKKAMAAVNDEHVGCKMGGAFPPYHGNFDGTTFYASAEWHGPCEGGIVVPEFDPGPLHAVFSIELETVACPG